MQLIFERHVLDTNTRELRRDSELVTVEPQVLDVLIYLIENRDRVVSRNDLIGSVWHGRNVSDSALSSRIYAARKAIGDSGKDQKLIRTVARRGLRFIGTLDTPASGVAPPDEAVAARLDQSRSIEAGHALPVSDRRVIAVLPFTNMSDDPEQEFFSDDIQRTSSLPCPGILRSSPSPAIQPAHTKAAQSM